MLCFTPFFSMGLIRHIACAMSLIRPTNDFGKACSSILEMGYTYDISVVFMLDDRKNVGNCWQQRI